ncbi:16734_t:CDS:2 [Acaulospora colombiana]|uniref:16734_t:CDS:1 n=1 Tax=Acaulospora colombiana TaxID=27376 RepID=A0ACA9KGI5_9GLOM|nr:16734_t:CDS:2 [Acaulospora colombiana]
MIVDCERDKIEVTAHELLKERFGEIILRFGESCGGLFVEQQFLKFIESKVGAGAVESLKCAHYSQYQYMIQRFYDRIQIPFTGEDTSFSYEFDLENTCPIIRDYVSVKHEMERDEWVIELDYKTENLASQDICSQELEITLKISLSISRFHLNRLVQLSVEQPNMD